MGHTVKIILQDDLPGGKAYAGDVLLFAQLVAIVLPFF